MSEKLNFKPVLTLAAAKQLVAAAEAKAVEQNWPTPRAS